MCFLFHHGYFLNNRESGILLFKIYILNVNSWLMELPDQSVSDAPKLEPSQIPPSPSPL